MGLLHELGDFLLFRASEEGHAAVHEQAQHWDCRRRSRVERELFGFDHGQLLARCLGAWMFPDEFVRALEVHTEVHRGGPALARALVAGQAVGTLALSRDEELRQAAALLAKLESRLEVGSVEPNQAWALSRQARHDAAQLVGGFTVEAEDAAG